MSRKSRKNKALRQHRYPKRLEHEVNALNY